MFDEKEILHLKEVYNSKYSDKITEMNPDKIWEKSIELAAASMVQSYFTIT